MFGPTQRIFVVAIVAASCLGLLACESDQERARDTALTFLEYELRGKQASAYELVAKEDQAAKPKGEYVKSAARLEQLRKELGDNISHKVKSVTVAEDKATASVSVEVTAPDIFKAALDNKDVAELPMTTNARVVALVREGEKWKVDTDWAEEKTKAEEAQRERESREKADKLVDEAQELIRADEMGLAKEKLEKALKVSPGHELAESEMEGVQAQLEKIVAGQWRLTRDVSEMTDEENAYAYLPSSNFVSGMFDKTKRATLYIRCREGDFNVYVVFPGTVSLSATDFRRGTPVRFRFDKDDAEDVYMSRSNSGDSLFVERPARFLERLRGSKKFLIEAPLLGDQDLWRFELTGSSKALTPVYEVCGKSP